MGEVRDLSEDSEMVFEGLDSVEVGTSRLFLDAGMLFRLDFMAGVSFVSVGEIWTGNLVSGPPELRSLR